MIFQERSRMNFCVFVLQREYACCSVRIQDSSSHLFITSQSLGSGLGGQHAHLLQAYVGVGGCLIQDLARPWIPFSRIEVKNIKSGVILRG